MIKQIVTAELMMILFILDGELLGIGTLESGMLILLLYKQFKLANMDIHNLSMHKNIISL